MTETAGTTPTLGVAFVPSIPPERLVELAKAVEESGLDELWVWEDCFKQSGLASAAIALASTERIRVGIGLLPVPLRNVAITAMELATVARAFPDRLIAGVGHGVQDWMGQVGARVSSPLTLLEEYTDALRRLLGGEEVTVSGRYVQLEKVQLDWPPTPPPPLLVGGSGPKSVALAARIGDGNLLAAALSHAQIAGIETTVAENSDRDPHPIVVTQIATTGIDADRELADELAIWGVEPAPGRGVAGDATMIAADVDALVGLGATSVAFQPAASQTELLEYVRFLGREVAPLVRHR